MADAETIPETGAQGLPQDNGELLRRMWFAQARALLSILETTPPSEIPSATLTVVRAFLADNRVDADTIKRMQGELARLRQFEREPFDNKLPFNEGDGSETYHAQASEGGE